MAYKYALRGPDGSPIEFESETMLTRNQAKDYAAQLYNQNWAEQQQLEATAEESRGVFGNLRDQALGFGAGVLDLVGSGVIGGGATLLGAEEFGEDARELFGGDAEKLREMQTPQRQARREITAQRMADVADEDLVTQIGGVAKLIADYPSVAIDTLVEQLGGLGPVKIGSILGREGTRRLLGEATEEVAKKAIGTGTVTGAIAGGSTLNATDVGMNTYDRVLDQALAQGMPEDDARQTALEAARSDALQAMGVTGLTSAAIPGAREIERVLGRVDRGLDQLPAARNFAGTRGFARGALGEAAQEAIEEGSGAYISNISAIEAGEDVDPLTGVGSQGAFGAVVGAGLGGPLGFVGGRRDEAVRRYNEAVRQAQAQQEAEEQTRQQAERRTAGVMQQQDLPGFEPGVLPEVQGPPAPPAETTQEPEFQLEPSGDLGISERQGELDLQPPAVGQPSVQGASGQRGFDFRSTQEQLDAIESQLADFNQVFGDLTPSERRQVRRGLIEERDRLQNELILNPRPAEAAAATFEGAQPDLLGFYQPTPETSGAVEAEAETRDQARQRIEAARRRQAGETFGGPQQELELGTPVEPNVLTEERLAEFGLPAQARRPDRVRANFKKIAQRFEGRDLTDPEQRAQVESELAEIENRDAQWVEPFSQRMRQELQATEQQAEALRTERERIGLEQADREAAPRRELQEDVDFAVERGMQEEQDYRARAQAQRRESEAQTQEEQRRAALRRQLVDRQAERVREQATGRIPLTEEWKSVARTQLRQRQEEAQMRERGLDQMAEQEAADFELDMQYVEDTAPQLEASQKVAASDFVQQFTEAQALNDPEITQAIEQEARNQLGRQEWGRLKSGLSNQRRAQQRRLDREARGEVQPEQPDLFAQPETTAEPRGGLSSEVDTVEGAFDQQTQVIDAERRRLREAPTFDATTSTSQDARVPGQTAQTDQTIQTTLIGTGQVNGGFSVSVNFDENQGVDVPQGALVDPNANPTTNPDREANHLPSIQSDLDASPLSQWTQTLNDKQRQELSSRVERAYPKLTPRTSKFVYELPQPLGVVFNSTLFLNTDKFYNKNKDFLYYRVLAHEAGHLTHSNHANEIDALVRNNPAEIEAELINISTALYGNFDQQRVALQDHQYLASPNELLAELNTYRMVYPEWAQTYAPRLTKFLRDKQSSLTNGNSQFPHPETNWDDSDWQNAEITFSLDGNGVPIGVTAESNGKTLQQRIAGFNVDGMRDRPNFRARYIARMFGEVNDSTGEVNPVAISRIESAIVNEFAPEVEDAGRPTEDAEQPTPRRRGRRRAARREPEPAADERAAEPSVDVGGEQRAGAAEPSGTPDAGRVGGRGAPASTDTDGVPASDAALEGLPPIALPLQRAITDPTEANTNAVLNQANQDGVLSDEQLEDFRQKIQRGEQARAKAIMHVYNEVRDYEYFTANPSAALSMDRQIQSVKQAAGVTRAATDVEIDAQVREDLGPVDDDTDIVFSRAPFVNKRLSKAEDLKKTFSKLINRVKNTVEVEVVQSANDVPDIDVPQDVRGFYYQGKAYIIADRVSEFDFQTVLAHEAVGHAGLEGLLGTSAYNNLTNQVIKLKETNTRVQDIAGVVRRSYTNPQGEYTLNDKQEAREIIAHIAESKASYLSDSGIRRVWDNVVRRVRAALSKLGFVDPSDVLLDQLVYEAALHVQSGRSATRSDRVFIRQPDMAAHTMSRAWDKGYQGFSINDAGQYIRDIANGRIMPRDRTELSEFDLQADDSYFDQVQYSRVKYDPTPLNDGFDDVRAQRAATLSDTGENIFSKAHKLLRGDYKVLETFRTNVVNSATSVQDKLGGKSFDIVMGSTVKTINPYNSFHSAQRAQQFAASFKRNGSFKMNEEAGRYMTVREEGQASMEDVFITIRELGQKIGYDNAIMSFDIASVAQRELELDKKNAELQRQADTLRANGKNEAAVKLENQIIDTYGGLNSEQVAERQRQNRENVKLFTTYPELRKAFDQWTQAKNKAVDFAQETGVLSEEQATNYKNAVGYIPFNRFMDESEPDNVSLYEARASSLVNLAKIPRMQGSTREVKNVLENGANVVDFLVVTSLKNKASKDLALGLKELGGIEAEYASKEEVPANSKDRPYIISWMENGKEKYALPSDRNDAYAWQGIEAISLPWLSAVSVPANVLRKSITLSPDFILGQLIQDMFRAYALGGSRQPLRTALRVPVNFVRIRKALAEGKLGPEVLANAGIIGQFDTQLERARQLDEIAGGQELNWIQTAVRWGERNAEASDLAMRLAVYEAKIADGASQAEAYYAAEEIINFNSKGRGRLAGFARASVPFFGAYVRGMAVLVNAMQGRGLSSQDRRQALLSFWGGMARLSVIGSMYALAMADDDEYANQSSYIRASNFLIPTGDGSAPLRIRMPADIALFTKMLPETIIMGMMRDDMDSKKLAREFSSAVYGALSGPNLYPQVLQPLTEVALNRSFLYGGPIVGMAEQNLLTQEQYRPSTSEFAKLFGYVGLSPLKVDYFIRASLGYTGATALLGADLLYETATGDFKANREIADFPIARTLFTGKAGAGFRQDLYELRDESRKVIGSINLAREQGDFERAEEIIDDRGAILRVRPAINRLVNTIRKSDQRVKRIQDSDLPTAEKKRLMEEERAYQIRLSAQLRRMRAAAFDGE